MIEFATNSLKGGIEQLWSWIWTVLWRATRPFRTNTQKICPFHYRGHIGKVGSQEIPWVTGKFGLGVQIEAGQKLTEFCQENALVIAKPLFNNTKEDSTYGHHQMVNIEIRLIIFFVAKDGEALHSQQKHWEVTVGQIMKSFLLPNSDLNWRK